VLLGLPMDDTVGTADLPSLWNQGAREGLWLHWDGNNDRVEERNKSAAIGAGATPKSLDLPSMDRIAAWTMRFPPPPFPAARVDPLRQLAGATVYARECAACHAFSGERVGQVTPIEEVGTDPARLDSFTPALAEAMNTIGEGRPWRFQRFRKTNGYANMPLDGLWLRAPYLHNGSVPDVWTLLKPEERPAIWRRASAPPRADQTGSVVMGFDTSIVRAYDPAKLGWKYEVLACGDGTVPVLDCDPLSEGQRPITQQMLAQLYGNVLLAWNLGNAPVLLQWTPQQIEDRKIYNTHWFSQSNAGHDFTAVLSDAERRALIEYLKTL